MFEQFKRKEREVMSELASRQSAAKQQQIVWYRCSACAMKNNKKGFRSGEERGRLTASSL